MTRLQMLAGDHGPHKEFGLVPESSGKLWRGVSKQETTDQLH